VVTRILPVVGEHPTENELDAVLPATTVTGAGLLPETLQLPARPPSCTECDPAATSSRVSVALIPIAWAEPPSRLTV